MRFKGWHSGTPLWAREQDQPAGPGNSAASRIRPQEQRLLGVHSQVFRRSQSRSADAQASSLRAIYSH